MNPRLVGKKFGYQPPDKICHWYYLTLAINILMLKKLAVNAQFLENCMTIYAIFAIHLHKAYQKQCVPSSNLGTIKFFFCLNQL
jgi:hypothetical protein